METYSSTHILINFQFCPLYSNWKIQIFVRFAATFSFIYISLVSYFEQFLYLSSSFKEKLRKYRCSIILLKIHFLIQIWYLLNLSL